MPIPLPSAPASLAPLSKGTPWAARWAADPLWVAWFALLAFTLAWDFTGLDMAVMRHIGTPQGFPLKDQWWLVNVFHEDLRLAAQGLFGVMLVWALWPWKQSVLPARERRLLVALVLLSLLVVNVVKSSSRTSCPWDLQAFGGTARYVSHWALGVRDGGTGRCFPGGHVSSAFAFFALCLPWLQAPAGRVRRAAPGWRWLALVLVVGLVAGVTQTLRGAHHPSHSLWTLVICTGMSMAGWRWAQAWLRRGRPAAAQAGKP